MTIDSLTIVTPRVNPIQYTSLSQIDMSGGVFSSNLDRIEVTNLNNPSGGVLIATVNNIGGDEYDWSITAIDVISIGLNTLSVTAYDTASGDLTVNVLIYVDYSAPRITQIIPSGVDIALNASIQVLFNEPMQNNIINHITLSPTVAGGYWQANANKTICEYIHTTNLDSNTAYTITVDSTCKDAIVEIDVADIYGSVGNLINNPNSFNFTTGLALGPHNPTRLGLIPPEPIRHVDGENINEPDIIISKNSVINSMVNLQYLTTSLILNHPRKFQAIGMPMPIEINTGIKTTNNIPLLIRPFRDKKSKGLIVAKPLDDIKVTDKDVLNASINNSYLTTQFTIRKRQVNGLIFDLDDIETLNYIPMILNYTFDDETSSGAVHKVANPLLSLTWQNPEDRGDSRLYYQIEISRTATFAFPLIFNTSLNHEAFMISDDGNVFTEIGEFGSPQGSGYTRFICPAELTGGIWYIRLKTGNKIEGGV